VRRHVHRHLGAPVIRCPRLPRRCVGHASDTPCERCHQPGVAGVGAARNPWPTPPESGARSGSYRRCLRYSD
jgi:hypothetical protein